MKLPSFVTDVQIKFRCVDTVFVKVWGQEEHVLSRLKIWELIWKSSQATLDLAFMGFEQAFDSLNQEKF